MVALLFGLVATRALAQDGGVVDEAVEADAGEPEPPAHTLLHASPKEVLREVSLPAPPATEPPAYETYWQLGSGLNLGLIDLVYRSGHLWTEVSTVLGVPLASYQNAVFGGVVAVGYAVDLGFTGLGRWYFELFLEAVVGRVQQDNASGFVAGAGWGFGFRYSLPSGWTLQFRMPCFGMVVEDYNALHTFDPGSSVGDFYGVNLYGWSFLTFGRRF